jgi:uroporphyrinogen decarboxylase
MTGKERVKAIIDGRPVDRCAYWTGNPHSDSWPALFKHFGCGTPEEVYRKLGDDVRWIPVGCQPRMPRGYLAECDSVAQVEDFAWPNPDAFDLAPWLAALKGAEGYYRLSGNLSMFFHDDCFNSFGGMQHYFVKMYTNPDVVHALMRHVNDYYLRLNRRFFEVAGPTLEAYKVSHDFGTQTAVMMSTSMLEEFVFPYLKEQFDLGHEFGHDVFMHCCGAIRPILPRLIELGMDLLHPIQALAAGMDAESLREFKGQVTFVGGIDTQQLLRFATPDEIKREVRRVVRVLGPLVVSPSHEALLSDIPPENVAAMAGAAKEAYLGTGFSARLNPSR